MAQPLSNRRVGRQPLSGVHRQESRGRHLGYCRPTGSASPLRSRRELTALAFSPHGTKLVSAGVDLRPIVWDLAPQTKGVKPTPDELKRRWNQLAGQDARAAYVTGWMFAQSGARLAPAEGGIEAAARAGPGTTSGVDRRSGFRHIRGAKLCVHGAERTAALCGRCASRDPQEAHLVRIQAKSDDFVDRIPRPAALARRAGAVSCDPDSGAHQRAGRNSSAGDARDGIAQVASDTRC